MLVWIASYPKSGNTWVRAMFTAVQLEEDAPLDINRLEGRLKGRRMEDFEEIAGLTMKELSREEQLRVLPDLIADIAHDATGLEVRKTHDAFIRLADGRPVYDGVAGARVIHVVRDPRDIAISFASHLGIGIDDTIAEMGREQRVVRREGGDLVENIGSWSSNARSWLDQQDIPALLVRYEDLLSDPVAELARMLAFVEWECSAAALARAVELTRFEALQASETGYGFAERSDSGAPFFRQGVAGCWRNDLSRGQVTTIEADHSEIMGRLGYLTQSGTRGR